ncbi:sensor histidine kinase [Singulisphaera sp. GP187]|uniref:sensor histidine kinase n=1 Tax=Singulisphaera sp. GP187 TaxID=1882752 RepID=UPI0013566C06|nr:histidine kinase [Singulisphaera sp. GP187]
MARTHLVLPPGQLSFSALRRFATFLLFLSMALTEELVASQHIQMSARVVSTCAAGLLSGPLIGISVGLGAAWLRPLLGMSPPIAFGLVLAGGGFLGGMVHNRRPDWSLRSWTGFVLGATISLFRFALTLGLSRVFHLAGPPLTLGMEAMTAVINGIGVAVILMVFEQVRDLEESSRAAAMSEVRALQARMNPHFLFNALNTIAALATISPQSIPPAVARLGRFLRGSLEQHDRTTVSLREELDIVTAYLEIEAMRFGDRLRVETDVPLELLDAQVPPFLIQPLAENAVRHGLQPLSEGGIVRISARSDHRAIVITVEDNGVGLSPEAVARFRFDSAGPEPHAVSLLKRRLDGLYGREQRLEFRPREGGGTVGEIRIPSSMGGERPRS